MEKSKGKLCKNCKNLRAYYELKNCFIINKKLYYKQEEKIGKKFILYQEFNIKKIGSKKSKEKESSSDFLDNNNTHTFIKKELGYFCAHLNRKN